MLIKTLIQIIGIAHPEGGIACKPPKLHDPQWCSEVYGIVEVGESLEIIRFSISLGIT